MECKKCKFPMHQELNDGVYAFACLMCGNMEYPGFPKRIGTVKECEHCGEEFEGTDKLCNKCKPKLQSLCVCGNQFDKVGNKRYCSDECTASERKKRRSSIKGASE
jgi:hypothetical protein